MATWVLQHAPPRYVPNALSVARMAAVPVLAVLAALSQETAFTWLLIPALLTDIADGQLARAYHLETQVGALLDSVADMLLLLVSVYGIWMLHPEVVRGYPLICGAAAGLWVLENLLALARYGRLSSFHTCASKVVANVMGFFVGWLFVFGFEPWLLYAAAGGSILASLEELVLLALLPKWRADVRGAWWVLREHRAAPAGAAPGARSGVRPAAV